MRTRDLKPGFWVDERIVSVSDSAKLLYQGLWGIADREGKLEYSPLTIGFQVRPWAPNEVPALLGELVEVGLVRAYAIAGKHYLIIPTLPEHQRFHPNEKPRGLPGPDDVGATEEHLGDPRGAPKREQQPASKAGSSVPSVPSVPAGPSGPAASLQPPAAEKRTPPTAIIPPTTPPELWLSDDFWRWAESRRRTAGCQPQGPPHPSKLQAWWSTARALTETPELQQAFLNFGDDKHWQHEKPALPFGAFMAQWNDFLPLRKRNAS